MNVFWRLLERCNDDQAEYTLQHALGFLLRMEYAPLSLFFCWRILDKNFRHDMVLNDMDIEGSMSFAC